MFYKFGSKILSKSMNANAKKHFLMFLKQLNAFGSKKVSKFMNANQKKYVFTSKTCFYNF